MAPAWAALAGQGQHLVGHVDAVGEPGLADSTGRPQYVDPTREPRSSTFSCRSSATAMGLPQPRLAATAIPLGVHMVRPLHGPFTHCSYEQLLSVALAATPTTVRVNGSWKEISRVFCFVEDRRGDCGSCRIVVGQRMWWQNTAGGASDGGVSGTVTVDGSSTVAP